MIQFKAIFRRLSGAKSRKINAEMNHKTPKMRLREFRNTLWCMAMDIEMHVKDIDLRIFRGEKGVTKTEIFETVKWFWY